MKKYDLAVIGGGLSGVCAAVSAAREGLSVLLVEKTGVLGGARPSHAKWQGKVFSRIGRVTIDGVTYEDFRKATGYGRGDGLGGWNCRHTFFPYVPGSSRSWTDKELKALEEKKVEYNGEKYTEYEASQIQRGIERDIRKLKRTVAAIEATGEDASAERATLRKAQKSYTDFSEQTKMKKQSARTQIASKKAEREAKTAYAAAGVSSTTGKPLTNPANDDKINLNRQTENVGAFSDLQERMSKKNIRTVAKEHGVNLKGVTISIDKNEELLKLPFAGSANGNKIGEITFLPNAFKDKETLLRTIFHETRHIEQYREYGAEFVYANATRFENDAYEAEEEFIKDLKQRGVL